MDVKKQQTVKQAETPRPIKTLGSQALTQFLPLLTIHYVFLLHSVRYFRELAIQTNEKYMLTIADFLELHRIGISRQNLDISAKNHPLTIEFKTCNNPRSLDF